MIFLKSMNILNTLIFFVVFHLGQAHLACHHDNLKQDIQILENEVFKDSKLDRKRFLLSTKQPIRITSDFSRLSSIGDVQKNHIISVFNVAQKFYQDLLKVIPYQGNLKFSSSLTCGTEITVSDSDRTVGIPNSDMHFYITSVNDPNSSYVAYAGACIVESSLSRPVFARIVYNLNYMKYNPGDLYVFNQDLDTTIHEMMHALGFSSGMYQYFRDQNGVKYDASKYTTQFLIMGQSQIFMQTPNVVNAAQTHFNCPSLQGMPLENEGSSGSSGSHWERTAVYTDVMGASQIFQRAPFTIFDAALLKDTGWYEVNDAMAEDVDWGKGQGCDFIYNACKSTTLFPEFCSSDQCDYLSQNYGKCDTDSFSSGCNVVTSYSQYMCQNDKISQSDKMYGYTFGYQSKCLESTLLETDKYTISSYQGCYKTQCDDSKTKATISVGSGTVICDSSGGKKTISGFTGDLKCPQNLSIFCNYQGCQNFCSENGYCNQNKCICLPGFIGADCNCKTFLYNNTCVPICPVGTQPDTNKICNNFCLEGETTQHCKTCSNNKCSICQDNYFLDSNSICSSCSQDCSICTDSLTCTQCTNSKFLQNKSCVSQCDIGYFVGSNSVCTKCIDSCDKCLNASTCDTCTNGFYYYSKNSKCVQPCPSNTYIKGNQCLDCDSSCDGCNGSSNSNCIKCKKYKYGSTCIDSCSSAQYVLISSNGSECKDCPANCLLCTGDSQCTKCNDTSPYLQDGKCQNLCNAAYFPDSTKTCMLCPTGCKACTASNQCTDCGNLFIQDGSCASQCKSGYFSRTPNNTCVQCSTNCSICSSETVCTQCLNNLNVQDGVCQKDCNQRYYSDSNHICKLCDSTCQNCNGPDKNNCISCLLPQKLYKSACYADCPPNTYSDPSLTKCLDCDVSCNGCSNSQNTDCTQCATGFTKLSGACITNTCPSGQVNQGGTCKSKCDQSYYPNQSLICIKCNSTCLTCSDSTGCTSCPASSKFNQDGICQTQCNSGFYADSNSVCKNCHSSCSTCTGASTSQCLTCSDSNSKFYLSTCYSTCPSHTYTNSNICQICDTSCTECTGPSNADCINCSSSYQKIGNTCINTTCNDGQYFDMTSKICKSCGSNCKSCTGQLSCTICNSGYNQDGVCQPSCNTGYYPTSSNICSKCKDNCDQCNSSTCIKCSLTYVLQSGNCQSQCNLTFYESTNQKCLSCILNCDKCTDSSTCDTCSVGFVKQNSTCKLKCDSNYIVDSKGVCQGCHSSCATCFGVLDTQCSTCSNVLKLYQNKCSSSCPSNTYALSNSNSCGACNTVCDGCLGPTESDCISCTTPYVKLNSACKDKCLDNQYAINRVCRDCDNHCASCTGQSACKQCYPGFVLQGGICLTTCNEGYYNNSGVCSQCASNCKTCQSSSPNQCDSCVGVYILFKNSCIANCDGNRYLSLDKTQCLDCNPVCNGCSNGNTDDKCTQCVSAYQLLSGRCISRCSLGQFYNGTTCTPCQSGCNECINILQCIKCQTGLVQQNGQCKNSCDPGYQANSNNECIQCYSRCKTCTGSNKDQCSSCLNTYKLYEGQCLDDCPQKTFMKNQKCIKCHENCLTCLDEKEESCQMCDPSYFKNGNSCVLKCNSNQYIGKNQACFDCGTDCVTCSSLENCQQCSFGNIVSQGKCIKQPTSDEIKRDIKCHFSCLTCIGSGYNQCTSCPQTRYLSEYYSSTQQGECICQSNTTDMFKTECEKSLSAEYQRKTQIVSTSISSGVSLIAASISIKSPLLFVSIDFQQTVGSLSYINKKNAMQYDDTSSAMRKLSINYLISSPFGKSKGNTKISTASKLRILSFENNIGNQHKISQMHGSDSFLENAFILFLINSIFLVLMIISKICCSYQSQPYGTFYKILSYIQLTVPVFVLLVTITELSICILLEFILYDTSFSEHKGADLALAIIAVVYIVLFLTMIFYQAYNYEVIMQKNNHFYLQVFMSLLKLEKFLHRAHFGILLFKKFIQAVLIVALYSSPIACLSVLLSIEVLFTVYLVVLQPFRERSLNVVTIYSTIGQSALYLIFLISSVSNETDSDLQTRCMLAMTILTNVILLSYAIYMLYLIFISVRKLLFKEKYSSFMEYKEKQAMTEHQLYSNNFSPYNNYNNNPNIYENEEQLYGMLVTLKNQTIKPYLYSKSPLKEYDDFLNKSTQNTTPIPFQPRNFYGAFSNNNHRQQSDLYERNKRPSFSTENQLKALQKDVNNSNNKQSKKQQQESKPNADQI